MEILVFEALLLTVVWRKEVEVTAGDDLAETVREFEYFLGLRILAQLPGDSYAGGRCVGHLGRGGRSAGGSGVLGLRDG